MRIYKMHLIVTVVWNYSELWAYIFKYILVNLAEGIH